MSIPTLLRRALTAVVLSAATLSLACGDDDDTPATPTTGTSATTAASPSPTEPANSPTTEPVRTPATAGATATTPAGGGDGPTGRPALDAIAVKVAGGDLEAVVDDIEYLSLACTTAQGAGGPPKCAQGEASGTVIEVLPLTGCEVEYVRPDMVLGLVTRLLKSPVLHSAFALADQGTAEFPRGVDGVLFEVADGGVMFGVDDAGKIVSVTRGCALPVGQLFERESGEEIYLEP